MSSSLQGPSEDNVARLRRAGAIAIAVIALAIAGAVFLLDRIALGSPVRIRVMFRHSAGLRERAPLVVAGQPIGRVESISPVPHGASAVLAGELGVAVTVAIDDGDAWKVPVAAEIFVASRGPVSDRYLEVAPPAGDPGPAIRDGVELRGIDPPSLDSVLQRTWHNLTVFHEFVEAVRPELRALRGELDRLRGHIDALERDPRAAGGVRALIDETRALIATARHTRDTSLGGEPGLARLASALSDARATLVELRAAIDDIAAKLTAVSAEVERVRGHVRTSEPIARAEHAIAALRAALDKIEPLVAEAGVVAERIARGEGSLMLLIRDPEFPEDAKDLGKVIKRHPWRILEHGRE